MTAQTTMLMQGNKSIPPYTLVFWTATGQPDTTDINSGFPGQLDPATIKVNSIIQNGYTANPLTLIVGGDLTGTLPSPSVSGLQGQPIAVTAPTSGQVLEWNGTSWLPTTPSVPSATVGGDLSGTLPNPTVVKLQGNIVGAGVPTSGQALIWSGSAWRGSNTVASLAVTSGNITGLTTLTLSSPLTTITNTGSGTLINDPSGGGITIDSSGGGGMTINGSNGINLNSSVVNINPGGSNYTLQLGNNSVSGGTGYSLAIIGSSAQVGAGTGGNIILTPGLGASSHNGNVAINTSPSSAAGTAGGSGVIWIGDRAVAPGTNPSGGSILYSEGGVIKIRSAAITVTLGNKPNVTGSKASGAALASLLAVLDTAGLITNLTTA